MPYFGMNVTLLYFKNFNKKKFYFKLHMLLWSLSKENLTSLKKTYIF